MEVTKDVSQPEIRIILDYWLNKRGEDVVPLVRAIDPAEISPDLLPWLFLFQREDTSRFRCCLVGTGIVRIDGSDSTGQYLDEILQGSECEKKERIKLFDDVVRTGMPLCYRGRRRVSVDTERSYSRLLLPVSSGKAIDHVFGMVRFGPLDSIETQRKAHNGRVPRVMVRGKTMPGFGDSATA